MLTKREVSTHCWRFGVSGMSTDVTHSNAATKSALMKFDVLAL